MTDSWGDGTASADVVRCAAECAAARRALLILWEGDPAGVSPDSTAWYDAFEAYERAAENLVMMVRRIADPAIRRASALHVSRSDALSPDHLVWLLDGYCVLDGAIRDAVCDRGRQRFWPVIDAGGTLLGDLSERFDRSGGYCWGGIDAAGGIRLTYEDRLGRKFTVDDGGNRQPSRQTEFPFVVLVDDGHPGRWPDEAGADDHGSGFGHAATHRT